MQSKGTLGSIIAGVIAIFLVLVCLFYLSFTMVSSKQEKKAEKPVKTGDDTPIFFWAVVALLSFTFLITCDIFHKKKK